MPDTDVKQSVITGTVDYLKGQPFNNVLLTALLAVVCLGLGYGLPWAVREAKSGARELISDCKEERSTTQNKPGDWGHLVTFASAKALGLLAAANRLNVNHRSD